MASEAQRKANKKYDEANTVQMKLKLNLGTDKDIIDKLNQVDNKQGYIKNLIRQDLNGMPLLKQYIKAMLYKTAKNAVGTEDEAVKAYESIASYRLDIWFDDFFNDHMEEL